MTARQRLPRSSLADDITSDLRERILNGELPAGETIRQESLASEYDVSRMPIREALKRLDAEGLVTFSPRRGARVAIQSPQEIVEIFDLRTLIEVDLFRRAIPKMTETDFARCDAILQQMEESFEADNVPEWGRLNHAFHAALYVAAGRRRSEEVLASLSLHSDRFVRMHLSVMEQREPAKKEHRALLSLAEDRNIEAACMMLTSHIQRTKGQLLDLVCEQP